MYMKKYTFIDTEDVICYKDTIWFSATKFNGLYCINIISGNMKVREFPQERYWGKRLFCSMKLVDNKIYCIPFLEICQ